MNLIYAQKLVFEAEFKYAFVKGSFLSTALYKKKGILKEASYKRENK